MSINKIFSLSNGYAYGNSYGLGNKVHPRPIMYYYFVVDCVKPALNLPINPELQDL
jgi:hypothetical protein